MTRSHTNVIIIAGEKSTFAWAVRYAVYAVRVVDNESPYPLILVEG